MNRLRNTAARQGLRLVKSRRRDPRALDFGRLTLERVSTGETVFTGAVDLDAVEEYLTGDVRNRETTASENDSAA